ncbi:hypothetical protein LP420_11070 [Massilia sp. B-10]|nr:hypothetical protein LP420_11070 [Massilia sp. B-10]
MDLRAQLYCLASQLHPFIVNNNITDLVIQTHSNGGNVMRWMMSNPTQDARYPVIINAIRWVNAIAPSSLGTPLADAAISGNVFESAVGWLLGYKSDAVRMQQQSWMANYNATLLYGTMPTARPCPSAFIPWSAPTSTPRPSTATATAAAISTTWVWK